MRRIVLYFYILCICGVSSIPPQQSNSRNKNIEKIEDLQDGAGSQEKLPEIKVEIENKDNTKIEKDKGGHKKTQNVSLNTNTTTPKILVDSANIKTSSNTEIESGAVMRGIFVFVGITMICIMYIGFKTYFRGRGNKKTPLIKKYGVKTRRSDMEMEPLPLDEDEDDETVFDLGHVTNR